MSGIWATMKLTAVNTRGHNTHRAIEASQGVPPHVRHHPKTHRHPSMRINGRESVAPQRIPMRYIRCGATDCAMRCGKVGALAGCEYVEILDRVIERYESGEVHWRQYGPNDNPTKGGLCVQQALWGAFTLKGGGAQSILPYFNAVKAVRQHVQKYTIPTWNDDPELTFSDMLDTLKAVANGLRSNT